jgi:hypothetical protein
MDLVDGMTTSLRMNQTACATFLRQSERSQEDAMPVSSSRDIAAPPRKDETREQEKAMVKDATKTDQADRDHVHGDGHYIGLDRKSE